MSASLPLLHAAVADIRPDYGVLWHFCPAILGQRKPAISWNLIESSPSGLSTGGHAAASSLIARVGGLVNRHEYYICADNTKRV
jgi:hypothetical protein